MANDNNGGNGGDRPSHDRYDRQTLVELTQGLARVAELLESFLKDWRRTVQSLGKDIDEVPSIVRLDLEKLEKRMERIERATSVRSWLDVTHRILSKSRHDLWMAKQASEEAETEAQYAMRRFVDFVRDSVRAEIGEQPEALVEMGPSRVSAAIVVGKKNEDDTGVHLVYDGKTVGKVSAEKIWKWIRWTLLPVLGAAAGAGITYVTNYLKHH